MSNFKESEIKGYLYIDGVKVTYLKMGVKREPQYNKSFSDIIGDASNRIYFEDWVKAAFSSNKKSDNNE